MGTPPPGARIGGLTRVFSPILVGIPSHTGGRGLMVVPAWARQKQEAEARPGWPRSGVWPPAPQPSLSVPSSPPQRGGLGSAVAQINSSKRKFSSQFKIYALWGGVKNSPPKTVKFEESVGQLSPPESGGEGVGLVASHLPSHSMSEGSACSSGDADKWRWRRRRSASQVAWGGCYAL